MELDTTDDHLIFDGKEPVTLKYTEAGQRSNDGTVTEDTVSLHVDNCLRRQVSLRESIDSAGRLRVSDVFWEVWSSELPEGFEVLEGMSITPDKHLDQVWEVLAVDISECVQCFRCHCRK